MSWRARAALGDISTGIKEVPEEGGRRRRGEKGEEAGFFHVRLYLGAIGARRVQPNVCFGKSELREEAAGSGAPLQVFVLHVIIYLRVCVKERETECVSV